MRKFTTLKPIVKMPIIESRNAGVDTLISVYQYEEEEKEELEKMMDEDLARKTEGYHPKKVMENLMIRKLLAEVLPDHSIRYRDNGKPYLHPTDWHISISHSFPLAALALSRKRVGIDLEKIQPKISKIKHKFLYYTEFSWTENLQEIEYLTIIWAIKEAMYKIHPAKYWSLKEHYEVFPFDLTEMEAVKCHVFDQVFDDYFTAQVTKVDNYYFAVIEKDF